MTAEAAPSADRGIYTTYAFISSSLSELRVEREALARGLTAVSPHFYDHEHGAAFESHREEWRHDLTRCHVYIGIFWRKLGPWTRDEYDFARAQGKPMLLYFKGPYEWDGREDELRAFIASLGDVDRQGAGFFEGTADEFARLVNADLEREQAKAFASSIERRQQLHTETGLTYTPTPDGGRADEASAPPPAAVRRAEVSRLEPFEGEFLDREDVLEELVDVLGEDAGDELVELVGPKGMGKGSLLQRLLMEDLDQFPDGAGVNPVGAAVDELDDLLRTVFDAFYEGSDPEVVTAWTPETLRAHLAGTHEGTQPIAALVVFEDVPPASAQFAALRSALPKSLAVCITTEGETGDGLDVPVEGFEDAADVLALFAQRYKAPIPEKAAEHVLAACAAVGNAPGAIRELGRLASREAKPAPGLEPLVAWARAKAEAPPDQVLTRGGAAKEAVRALLAAGGEAPAAVVGAVGGAEGAGQALADGIIEPGSPRYRLGSVVTHDVAGAAADDRLMGAILDSAVAWAESARLDEIRDDRAFVSRMAEWGVAHGRYGQVLRLAEAADPALAMGVRWDAWERVLLAALEASRALDKPCAEGWARHQLGTRALLLGDRGEAREQLTKALELRRAHCPFEAADLTEHNLRLAAPPGPRVLPPVIRLLPGFLAAAAVLLLAGLFGPRGGIADFDVPFGAVQVAPGEETIQLFRLGPDEYRNDRATQLELTISLTGDPEFCLALAGTGDTGGRCIDPSNRALTGGPVLTCVRRSGGWSCGQDVAGATSLGRAPPRAYAVPGQPLAQGAAGAGCEIFGVPGAEAFVLSIAPGGTCPVLFGFDPPDQPGLELAATASFSGAGSGTWRGELTGSTFTVNPVLEVEKSVDADGDGAFAAAEFHPAASGEAEFEVTVINAREGSALVLRELADNRYGDVTRLDVTECAVGGAIAPGGSYTCRYRGPVAPGAGSRFENIVTATVELAGEPFSASATAAVLFADPDAAVVVTKQVDADGDGTFASSERFSGDAAGAVAYRLTVENRSDGDVAITAIDDDAFGDLTALPGSTCGAVGVPPGGTYECRFTGEVDPSRGEPHRNVVAVTVDPPLDSPYLAGATVTFGTQVEVEKTVDVDGDGAFRPSEPLPDDDAAGEPRRFRVEVRNLGPADVELVALDDSVYGDLGALGESTCVPGATIAAGAAFECEFRAVIDAGAASPHENVVTATVAGPGGEADVASNPVVVPLVGGGQASAALLVDADGDGAFGATESAPEGGDREVTYRIEIDRPEGAEVRILEVVIDPVPDAPDFGDCTPGAALDRCSFTATVGGNAGESIAAALDTARLINQPGASTATVRFTDAPPSLAVDVSGPAAASRGDTVTIGLTVRNTSAETDPVALTSLATGAGTALADLPASTCDVENLAPAATLSCSFALAITAAPGATQSVTVVATGADDEGNTVVASGGHSVVVTAVGPFVEISKRLDGNADEDGSGTISAGDTLTYELTVLNGGTATLTAVTVRDPRTGFAGACGGRPSLAPGQLTTCTTTYAVTAADALAGEITNTASVAANAASGPVTDTVSLTVAVPGLTITKTLEGNTDPDGSNSVTAGDRLTFGYRVTAVADFDSVTVADPLPGLLPLACEPPNGSRLSGVMLCTAEYVVTQADANAGIVASTARATGVTAAGQTLVAQDALAVPVAPALIVVVETSPPSGAAFDFTGAVTATLRNGERAAVSLAPGTYTVDLVQATRPDHWTLTEVVCDDPAGASSTGDAGAGRATYRLDAAERVTCTFRFRGEPVVDAAPELVEFAAPVPVGSSVSRVVTVTNIGTRSVALTGLAASGDAAVGASSCGGALGPGDDCSITVVFTPSAVGSRAGLVVLSHPAAGSDTEIVVIGSGS